MDNFKDNFTDNFTDLFATRCISLFFSSSLAHAKRSRQSDKSCISQFCCSKTDTLHITFAHE